MKLKKKYKIILIVLVTLITLCVGVISFYNIELGSVSNSTADKEVVIPKGSGAKEIAKILKDHNLIKNEFVFLIYTKINNVSGLKFGTYLLQENMDVKKIIETLKEGSKYNPDEVTITIKEGITMRDIASEIAKVTSNSYEDVINKSNDIEYINSLKEKYWFITDKIENNDIYYKLEGYLYPDTYRLTNKDVSVEYIFNKMLDAMDKVLTPNKELIENNKLNIHEIITLASMVEKEASREIDRKDVASVFVNRIKYGMSLGSDVTTRYAFKVDNPSQVLTKQQYVTQNPYNTRVTDGSMNGKLPVGPISTISKSSIEAAISPNETDYLYFIANIKTKETFFYHYSSDFERKKQELAPVNGGF